MGLQLKKKSLYLFDFGDEWLHSIHLLGITEEEPKGRYPRIVASEGTAPPRWPFCGGRTDAVVDRLHYEARAWL